MSKKCLTIFDLSPTNYLILILQMTRVDPRVGKLLQGPLLVDRKISTSRIIWQTAIGSGFITQHLYIRFLIKVSHFLEN
ncbi:hypothetical protein Hanom_Chr04g00370921 [Helianthus anomalus]